MKPRIIWDSVYKGYFCVVKNMAWGFGKTPYIAYKNWKEHNGTN